MSPCELIKEKKKKEFKYKKCLSGLVWKKFESKHELKKIKMKRVENRQHIIKIYLESR
jgi:hypothetical protein